METIVELAKLQHALGIPFERVTVRAVGYLPQVPGNLGPWVGAVDCDVWYSEEEQYV